MCGPKVCTRTIGARLGISTPQVKKCRQNLIAAEPLGRHRWAEPSREPDVCSGKNVLHVGEVVSCHGIEKAQLLLAGVADAVLG